MPDTFCDDIALPSMLAWDFNFLPDEDGKFEVLDLGGSKRLVILGSHTINSKMLVVYDQDWDY